MTTATCKRVLDRTDAACGRTVAYAVKVACVHEHARTTAVCDDCYFDMVVAPNLQWCRRCWEPKETRHECVVRVELMGFLRERAWDGTRRCPKCGGDPRAHGPFHYGCPLLLSEVCDLLELLEPAG